MSQANQTRKETRQNNDNYKKIMANLFDGKSQSEGFLVTHSQLAMELMDRALKSILP